MKVDYDSEGRSLLFELGEFGKDDYVEELAGGICIVWVLDGHANSIQLLGADHNVEVLDEAAERFDLDPVALRAAARAALAAPHREITIDVGRRLPSGSEEEEAEAAASAATSPRPG
jgi:hypothetical protein